MTPPRQTKNERYHYAFFGVATTAFSTFSIFFAHGTSLTICNQNAKHINFDTPLMPDAFKIVHSMLWLFRWYIYRIMFIANLFSQSVFSLIRFQFCGIFSVCHFVGISLDLNENKMLPIWQIMMNVHSHSLLKFQKCHMLCGAYIEARAMSYQTRIQFDFIVCMGHEYQHLWLQHSHRATHMLPWKRKKYRKYFANKIKIDGMWWLAMWRTDDNAGSNWKRYFQAIYEYVYVVSKIHTKIKYWLDYLPLNESFSLFYFTCARCLIYRYHFHGVSYCSLQLVH